MSTHFEKQTCPYSLRQTKKRKLTLKRMLFPIMGLGALIWFFVRVIPKPSRAAYPCQRAAFPIASSFVIWLTGIFGGTFIFKKLKKRYSASRYVFSGICAVTVLAAVAWNLQLLPAKDSNAAYTPIKLPAKSDVAIVQSTKTDVKQIDEAEIKQMVATVVDNVGGIGSVVKDGQTVVIKPNLIISGSLATEVNGVTTDWRVTKAIVELVRSVNPGGKVYVMEEGISDTTNIFKYYKYDKTNIPGVDQFIAIEKDSGAWQDKSSSGLTLVNMPDGLLHTEYYFNKKYKEADVVISVPTMKSHYSTGFTGGIKNLSIGTPPSNIYGINQYEIARNNMVNHGSNDLHKWIRDYYKCRPANLVIMDGLQGYQNGPFPMGRNPVISDQMNMRAILASKDAVALDTIGSLAIGWDPQSINYLCYLNTDKIGNMDPTCINVIGRKVDEVRKYFAGQQTNGASKITDKTPPQLTINSAKVTNNNLNISLTTDSETVKELAYIDGKLCEPASVSGMNSINLSTAGLGSGSHQLTVEAYDRFLNRTVSSAQFAVNGSVNTPLATPTAVNPVATPTNDPGVGYCVPRTSQAPAIDGIGNESCWQQAQWKDIKYVWVGATPSPDDFTGRFKMVWTPERLYYLVEITDDKLSSPNTTPFVGYYDNDCVELFIDENHSGGNHQNNYNAFAYHIQLDYTIIDNNTKGSQSYYNDHAKVMRTRNGNLYTWEIELKVFDDTYNENVTTNVPVTLTKDKIMGFGVSYNDNDNQKTRESFIGSFDIPGTDKNVAWINASLFDSLKLVDLSSTPTLAPTPTPTAKTPDLNGDRAVNMTDIVLLSQAFNSTSKDSRYKAAYDLNSDGAINMTDVMIIAAKFNTKI